VFFGLGSGVPQMLNPLPGREGAIITKPFFNNSSKVLRCDISFGIV
jgi:hypothetical protein